MCLPTRTVNVNQQSQLQQNQPAASLAQNLQTKQEAIQYRTLLCQSMEARLVEACNKIVKTLASDHTIHLESTISDESTQSNKASALNHTRKQCGSSEMFASP
ncbi:hypothetical protein D5086_005631 [Populus alba]|uniref:Uncharacterized protein n=1 Tax=Populus alba TaxID=43335 RepID=A0ACC4CV66_POPAL